MQPGVPAIAEPAAVPELPLDGDSDSQRLISVSVPEDFSPNGTELGKSVRMVENDICYDVNPSM